MSQPESSRRLPDFAPSPRPFWRSLVGPLAAIAVAFALWALQSYVIDAYYARIAMDIGIAMIMAVSLNIVNGMTGQFSMGHAGFMALGGYTAGAVTYYGSLALWGTSLKHGGPFGAGEWLFALSCLVGGAVAAVAGFVVGLPSLRLRGDYLAIVTLGFGEILRVLLQESNDVIRTWPALKAAKWSQLIPPPLGKAKGFNGLPFYTNLFWVGLFLSLTVLIAVRLKKSGLGRSMIAIREDEIAAQAMGVDITRVKVRSFVLAAALAGVGGGLYAHLIGIISPQTAGFQLSFDYVIMTVLGGQGSVSGVMLSATVLTILPEVLRSAADYRLIVYALLLIGMMLLRPQGLLGSWEIWDLFGRKRRARQAAT
jgi:branched-chain amino acid transport system permease protein